MAEIAIEQAPPADKIETAVKFLQNPRVKETSLNQRKAFLTKKGLSANEISLALKQSGESDEVIESGVQPSRLPYQSQAVFAEYGSPYSALRWRDYFMVALIGGGVGYTLVYLVKTYILPYFVEQTCENEQKIDQLQSSVSELKENLSQTVCGIQNTLDSVQKLLQDQQQKVQSLTLSLSSSQSCLTQSLTDSYSLSEVKSELSSLKGLLLSRRQFPSPVVQSTPFPGIPAWQRNGATVTTVNTEDETGNTLGRNTESNVLSNRDGTLAQNGEDTSSGTLEEQQESRTSISDDDDSSLDQSHTTSCSTLLSSDVGSPSLVLNDLKESLSETYVKVPTD